MIGKFSLSIWTVIIILPLPLPCQHLFMQKYFWLIVELCYTQVMQATRAHILTYLRKHPRATVVDIGISLDMTAANIRYHMGLLVDAGLVKVTGKRNPGGAGRPILLYNLTPHTLGTNIAPLLSAMLALLVNKDADFQSIAEILAREINLSPENRILRFNQAVEYLNQMNYHASWEARLEGPQVILRHCPYLDLAETHHGLCQIDTKLISNLFDTRMELSKKRTFGKDPFSPCIFKPKP